MVAKVQNKVNGIQTFVVAQIEEAKKQLVRFEKEIVAKGRQQRRELEQLLVKVQKGTPLKGIGKRAEDTTQGVKKALDGLQARVVTATGVASTSQVNEIKRELVKLSKKIDGLVGKKPAGTPPAA